MYYTLLEYNALTNKYQSWLQHSMHPPKRIAILGGGITGLTSAFHLSRRFPSSLITVFEKENRFGGWVNSERVEVRDAEGRTASMLLESGPRTLRPGAKGVMELIHLLNLCPTLLTTSRTSAASRTRFLHIPSSKFQGLIPLPSSPLTLLRSPLFREIMGPVLAELFRRPNRPLKFHPGNPVDEPSNFADKEFEDESVDSFLSRRFGNDFARTFGSALVHGIYACDSRKLSVRAAFPGLWKAEERGMGSVVTGLLMGAFTSLGKGSKNGGGYEMGDVEGRMEGISVFSFRDGIGEITRALERWLTRREGVQTMRRTEVKSVQFDSSSKTFEIKTNHGPPVSFTHLISTLPLPSLSSLLPISTLPQLTHNPSASVRVLNLIFRSSPASLIHPAGFGYLIPRPKDGYETWEGIDGVLGCVFDSCAIQAQDEGDGAENLIKMTVMMRPSGDPMGVMRHLQRVLRPGPLNNDPLPDPLYLRVTDQKDCIPTYLPGHLGRIKELKETVGRVWEGRGEVVGAGVGGVSVGDCVEVARGVGMGWT